MVGGPPDFQASATLTRGAACPPGWPAARQFGSGPAAGAAAGIPRSPRRHARRGVGRSGSGRRDSSGVAGPRHGCPIGSTQWPRPARLRPSGRGRALVITAPGPGIAKAVCSGVVSPLRQTTAARNLARHRRDTPGAGEVHRGAPPRVEASTRCRGAEERHGLLPTARGCGPIEASAPPGRRALPVVTPRRAGRAWVRLVFTG